MSEKTDYIKRIIFDLLYYRRSSAKQTAWFRDTKHNNDLVPAIELKVNDVIDLFEKYHRISYDTQGIRDRGIDVLLRYEVSTEETVTKYIGFQIKSFDDIGQKGWLTKLKAQIFDAHNMADLEDLYILFCTDLADHRDQLRDLNAEFAKQKDVHVVRPEFAYQFIHLPSERIAAYLKTKLSLEDRVLIEAINCLQDYTIAQAAIIIDLATSYFLHGQMAFEIQWLRGSNFVKNAYEAYPRLPIDFYNSDMSEEEIVEEMSRSLSEEDQFVADLERLDTEILSIDSHNDQVRLVQNSLLPIGALILDGHVRYGYDGIALKEYLLSTVLEEKIHKAEEYKTKGDDAESKTAPSAIESYTTDNDPDANPLDSIHDQ